LNVATLPAGTTNFTDNSLQPGTLYEYQVFASDGAGSSPAADTGLTTLPLAPVVTAATQGGQVKLSWTASNGAVAYNIYRGLTPRGEGPAPYATVNNAANNATGFTDVGASAGQAYYYVVTAVDFSGESAPSSEITAVVPEVVISPPSASSTTGDPVTYTITYIDPFFASSTLSPGNITLNATGTASGTVGVSGTGPTRTVTISNITGDGSLGISFASGTASDTLGNLFPAAGPSATVTVDNTGPTVVSPASALPNPVNGTTTALSVSAADMSASPASLTYNWAATTLPNGAAMPVFGANNGSNAAANTTVTFSQAGAYVLTVTISDSAGLMTTSSVSVTVNQTLTTINATGQPPIIPAIDQFGNPLTNQPAFDASSNTITGPLSLASNVTVLPPSSGQLTVLGAITGTGSLIIDNPGTVVLSGTNSYTGGTMVAAGKLVLTNSSAISNGTSLTVGAGASQVFASSLDAAPSFIAATTPALTSSAHVAVATSSVMRSTSGASVMYSAAILQPTRWRAVAFVKPAVDRIIASPIAEGIAADWTWLAQTASGSVNSQQRRQKDVALLALETAFAQYGR
jgi:autotransporter-associated beta strand protein